MIVCYTRSDMRVPRAILFDLDETLAESFRPPTHGILTRFVRILAHMPTAIITGGSFTRVEHDFLKSMSDNQDRSNLFIFTNSAAECHTFKDGFWQVEYAIDELSPAEKGQIIKAIEETIADMPEFAYARFWGERISDRGAQIAYTVVGLDAPQEEKMSWDPDHTKRLRFRDALAKKLPGFEILIGGASTIDVTRAGVDKSHGVQWLAKHLGISAQEMLYVGDALFPGGNDYVVMETGIQTRRVDGPHETAAIMDEIIAASAAKKN
ncbi:HAD-IIB family hydrolase [Candidatus Kaiserbacteria bacterium]|nr:HAD-IIB family hydrolase [Candidatus Kaiserbacteria bacterium]